MKDKLHRWFAAWFYIFDYSVAILTLEFLDCGTSEWWYSNGFYCKKGGMRMSLGMRMRWWCCDFLLIIEELVLIITLGLINTSILSTNFLNWSRFLI